MNYFLDTEFIEGVQSKRFLGFEYGKTKPTIDLISIGIVAEDGRMYYAISKDFNLWEAWNRVQITTGSNEKPSFWFRENVLKPIFNELLKRMINIDRRANGGMETNTDFDISNMKYLINYFGKSNKEIAKDIVKFVYEKADILYNHPDCKVENIGEVRNKPVFYGYYADYDWVVFAQLFGIMMNIPKGFPYYCRDLKQMADEIWERTGQETRFPKSQNEHNALADAQWNKKFYDFLKDKIN